MASKTVRTERKDVESSLEICRLCMSTESLEDVFEAEGLQRWISDYLSIVVSIEDNISHAICTICRIRLAEFHQFRVRCQEVQATLGSMVRVEETVAIPKVSRAPYNESKRQHKPIEGVLQMDGQYQCETCWKVFDERRQILDHRRIHGPKKYACTFCEKSFPIRRYLSLHLRSHGYGENEHKSDEQEQYVYDLQAVKIEPLDADEDSTVQLQCSEDPPERELISEERSSCIKEEEARRTGNLSEEANIETTADRIEIEHVKVEAPSDDDTETESAVSENDEFEPYDDKRDLLSKLKVENVESAISRSKEPINTEMEEEYESSKDNILSDETNVPCKNTVNDEAYVKMQNAQGKPYYRCNTCRNRKVYTTKQKIKDHMRLVHGERKHACPVCGKRYVLESQLRRHVPSHDSATPYKCNMCEKSFKYGHSLWCHKTTQHSLQKNCCPDCGLQFAMRRQLDKHLRSKPHRMNVEMNEHLRNKRRNRGPCSNGTIGRTQIRQNIMVKVDGLLTDGGLYQCDECPKNFTERQQIKDHKRLVHGERKLACPVCDKRYIIPSQLRNHVRTHDKARYRCDACEQSFKHERTLWSHKRSKHGFME